MAFKRLRISSYYYWVSVLFFRSFCVDAQVYQDRILFTRIFYNDILTFHLKRQNVMVSHTRHTLTRVKWVFMSLLLSVVHGLLTIRTDFQRSILHNAHVVRLPRNGMQQIACKIENFVHWRRSDEDSANCGPVSVARTPTTTTDKIFILQPLPLTFPQKMRSACVDRRYSWIIR